MEEERRIIRGELLQVAIELATATRNTKRQ